MRAFLRVAVASAVAGVLLASPALSADVQYVQQGAKLTASDEIPSSGFGDAVAVSSDGNTALVGGPADAHEGGAAWVYVRSGSGWVEQQKLTPTGASGKAPVLFGEVVSLSADGNTAVVSGPGNDGGRGAVWVFTRTGTAWTEQQEITVSGGEPGGPGFGQALALSEDGSLLLVSATQGQTPAQAQPVVWVYARSGTVWQETQELSAPADAAAGSGFGSSVALSADGSVALLGGRTDGTAGAAWVYGRSADGSWVETQKLPAPSDAVGRAEFGYSVSLSADGHTALIGGLFDNSDAGAAWVYTDAAGTWSEQQKIPRPTGDTAGFFGATVVLASGGDAALMLDGRGFRAFALAGGSWIETQDVVPPTQVTSVVPTNGLDVAIAGDGSTAIMGTWVYTTSAGGWSDPVELGPPSDESPWSELGTGLGVSADGNTAIAGGPLDGGRIGAGWLFARAASSWAEQQKLAPLTSPPPAPSSDGVGQAVAISGDGETAVVGATGSETLLAGDVWVYTRSGSTWTDEQEIIPPPAARGLSDFGRTLALSQDGQTLFVGALRYMAPFPSLKLVGAVWIYTQVDGTWTLQQQLVGPADAIVAGPRFGAALSLSANGNTALIGSLGDGAWVFTRSGSSWSEQQYLAPPADAVGAAPGFGDAVALSPDGTAALVGAPGDSAGAGAAWAYTASGSTWSEQAKIAAPADASGASGFGTALALSGDGAEAVIGGPGDNEGAGAAWIYTSAGSGWSEAQKLTPGDESGAGGFGSTVALTPDAKTALVGAPLDDGGAGAVWAFTRLIPQSISFTSSPPATPAFTGTYAVSATGGGSGNPVTFSVDPSSTPGACAASGATVSFTGIGTCVIDANQAGGNGYLSAPQVQQTLVIAPTTLPAGGLCANLAISGEANGTVEVPPGASCLLAAGTHVTGDVRVESGASLIDQGATIDHDLSAANPAAVEIGGSGASVIGHDLTIDGLTGPGPGDGGDDYVCGTHVGHDLAVRNSVASAGPLSLGANPDCAALGGGNTIDHDLQIVGNADPTAVGNNTVGDDLHLANNTGPTSLDGNTVVNDAHCEQNTPPATGSGNTVEHLDDGCPL